MQLIIKIITLISTKNCSNNKISIIIIVIVNSSSEWVKLVNNNSINVKIKTVRCPLIITLIISAYSLHNTNSSSKEI